MATHSSHPVWGIPRTEEEPANLQPIGLQNGCTRTERLTLTQQCSLRLTPSFFTDEEAESQE